MSICKHITCFFFKFCSGPIPDAVQAYIQESSVASIIAIYYTLHTAKIKDRVGLMRILGSLSNCDKNRAFEDPFLHSLVNSSHF